MATKKFTKHAQRVLNHNPNVVKCTESKISFTEDFALKVVDALKAGDDPYKVFEDNGISLRVLGKSRVNGIIGLWKSKYELEDLPRRRVVREKAAPVETAKERRQKVLENAISEIEKLVADPTSLQLPEGADDETVHFAAIKKVYDSKTKVIVKDVIGHYGYSYMKYYSYLESLKPKDTFVNILNPHNKNK